MLSASSVDELGRRVAEEAQRLCAPPGAVFATNHGSWTAGDEPTLPRDLVHQVGSVGRTAARDGAVVVPVLANGRVVGIIGVSEPRNGADPAEQLAPLVGEGLANAAEKSATEQLAFVDGLTSGPNRRRFDLDLAHRSQEAASEERPVAVAMIDIDHFKTYNDSNGHQRGDEALRIVAQLISENIRSEDAVYRYGGEEFAVLLPGADLETARDVVERVRQVVAGHAFAGGPQQPGGRVTISAGVAAAPPPDGTAMLQAADEALYRSKAGGRNRISLAPPATADRR